MAERTLSGAAKEGWFIPYRYADGVDESAGYPGLAALFETRQPDFLAALEQIARYRPDLEKIGVDDPAPEPRWDQDWFAGLDAAAAYAMVRRHKPRRIIEVGSGHSTRFMVRAIGDGGIDCRVTAIDPAPRADISTLPVEIVPKIVQQAPPTLFHELARGDMLFIDSSHILMPGSDVDLLFAEIIPHVPPGVIVHIHDIFLPDPYPREWHSRGYNEQNALAPLIATGALKVLLPCQYVQQTMATESARLTGFIPRPRPNHDASIWLLRD